MKRIIQYSVLVLALAIPTLAFASMEVCLKLINSSTKVKHVITADIDGQPHVLKSGESYGFTLLKSAGNVVTIPFAYEDGLTGAIVITPNMNMVELDEDTGNKDMLKLEYQTFPKVTCGPKEAPQELKGYGIYLKR